MNKQLIQMLKKIIKVIILNGVENYFGGEEKRVVTNQ